MSGEAWFIVSLLVLAAIGAGKLLGALFAFLREWIEVEFYREDPNDHQR